MLYLLAKVAGGAWLSLASAAMLVMPLVALALPPRLDGLAVRRSVDDRVPVGRDVDVLLTMRNDSRRTTSPARLSLDAAGLPALVVAVPALAGGTEATVRLRVTAERRGIFDSGRTVLDSTAPLGLLRRRRELSVDGRVIVHPDVVPVSRLAGAATAAAGEVPTASPGVGTEVLGLRDWRSGDSARAVSARASARHGRPLVLERERDSGSALVLLAGGPGRGPTWEAAVSRGASLALAALAEGTAPLLLGGPAPARMDRVGVLDWFAGVDRVAGLDRAAVGAAVQAATGGTLVVLVPADLLTARLDLRRACDAARAHLVVLDA